MKLPKVVITLFLVSLLCFSACSTSIPTSSNIPATSLTPIQTSSTLSTTPTITNYVTPAQTLMVHFIDVGQGDSILIDMGKTEILIDGGNRNPGVINYLSAYVDGNLEVVVATHTDADHIGGMIAVLANYQVDDIWINGYTAKSKTYTEFMSSINAEGAAIHIAELGNNIQVGILNFIVLNPSKPLFPDANNNSIVLSLSYGEIDFLFTGDAEQEAEARMLLQSLVPVPDVEILKVGHHGSRTASSSVFLNVIKPEVAIYSCGVGNTYGHPHQETLTALDNIGAKIYGTDGNGTIEISTDGKSYEVKTEK